MLRDFVRLTNNEWINFNTGEFSGRNPQTTHAKETLTVQGSARPTTTWRTVRARTCMRSDVTEHTHNVGASCLNAIVQMRPKATSVFSAVPTNSCHISSKYSCDGLPSGRNSLLLLRVHIVVCFCLFLFFFGHAGPLFSTKLATRLHIIEARCPFPNSSNRGGRPLTQTHHHYHNCAGTNFPLTRFIL